MRKIRVRLKDRSYDIIIGRGLLKSLGLFVKKLELGTDAIVVTNARILRLYGNDVKRSFRKSGITVRFEMVPDSEKAKSVGVMAGLLNRISRYDKNKKVFLIALGGGVIGDLTGFVASAYKRGIPYVQVPTTLLAQVDSAIGGKTAIDLSCAKNLAGAIYQPKLVLSDITLLKSLPERELRNGLAEVIKYGMIRDGALFSFIEKNKEKIFRQDPAAMEYIVFRSSTIKRSVVEKDEFDKEDVRAILNYGHTLGHAIEAASAYSGRYTHGDAVAIGMLAAADIALRSGIVRNIPDIIRLRRLVSSCGLPLKASKVRAAAIWTAQLHDKKHTGRKNKFILPMAIGKVGIFECVPDKILKLSIAEMIDKRS
ncbi:MAG: 3-dehydroquinate synthase [Candidatus Omnitrophica bacterium]|nr:3-dehydroquinate synthase [Candidatus Omnitrophota bacterium]